MRGRVIAVLLLAAMPAVAGAQAMFPTAAAGVRAPGQVPLVCDAEGKNCKPPTRDNPLDPGNAAYTIGVQSTAAAGSFKLLASDVAATPTRAVKLFGMACTVTVTSPNGNTGTVAGAGDAVIAVSWSGLTSGCIVRGDY